MMQQRPTQNPPCGFRVSSSPYFFTVTSPAQTPRRPAKPIYPATTHHAPPAWFIDVASQAGIAVRNVNGSVDHKRYIIEATGSGVAIIDYDRDGWPDIVLVNGQEMNDKTTPGETPPQPLIS